MAMAPTHGKMAVPISAGGKAARCTAEALSLSLMETSTSVNGVMTNSSKERFTPMHGTVRSD